MRGRGRERPPPPPRGGALQLSRSLPTDHHDYASESRRRPRLAKAVLDRPEDRGAIRPFLLATRPPAQRLVRGLERKKPDVVFNLIEGFGGDSGGEARVTSLLELMDLPYTGCPPEAQSLGRNQGADQGPPDRPRACPPPDPGLVGPGDSPADRPVARPGLFVKPEREDASLGIGAGERGRESHEALSRPRREAVRVAHGPRVLVEDVPARPRVQRRRAGAARPRERCRSPRSSTSPATGRLADPHV